MAIFRRRTYDRTRILAEASRARKRGRRKKAIELYRQVLSVEPDNPEIHRRVAPLLALTKQPEESWKSYRKAAERLTQQGFVEQAIGVYREATRHLPRQVNVWKALADLEVERGRRVDAVKSLLEGRKQFRGGRWRQEALALLIQARKIEPTGFEPNFELAGLLAAAGAGQRARRLLEELIPRLRGRQLRRARGRMFRIQPTPANAWRWVRALGGR